MISDVIHVGDYFIHVDKIAFVHARTSNVEGDQVPIVVIHQAGVPAISLYRDSAVQFSHLYGQIIGNPLRSRARHVNKTE